MFRCYKLLLTFQFFALCFLLSNGYVKKYCKNEAQTGRIKKLLDTHPYNCYNDLIFRDCKDICVTLGLKHIDLARHYCPWGNLGSGHSCEKIEQKECERMCFNPPKGDDAAEIYVNECCGNCFKICKNVKLTDVHIAKYKEDFDKALAKGQH